MELYIQTIYSNYGAISLPQFLIEHSTTYSFKELNDKVKNFLKETNMGSKTMEEQLTHIHCVKNCWKKHKVNSHFKFIDFNSAFDTKWKKSSLKKCYEVSELVKISSKSYKNFTMIPNVLSQLMVSWQSVSAY